MSSRQPKLVSGAEVEATRRSGSHRPSTLMQNRCGGHDDGAEAGGVRAQTKVHVFEAEEKVGIELASPLKDFSFGQHHAAADRLDDQRWRRRAGGRCRDRLADTSVKHSAGRPVVADACRRDPVRRRAADHDGSGDSGRVRRKERALESLQAIGRYDDVTVDEKHCVGAGIERVPDAGIHASREAQVASSAMNVMRSRSGVSAERQRSSLLLSTTTT
jgi:hypothetical protein